jgi:hypothetical protein
LIEWHAPLRRGSICVNTAQWGVFWQGVCSNEKQGVGSKGAQGTSGHTPVETA